MADTGRTLDGLAAKPAWMTHMGCQQGCVEYLGIDISRGWIYGGTGHAFALNIHEELCPSGPTAWNCQASDLLARDVGYLAEGVTGERCNRDFEARQKIAWALVTGCIDNGVPCYGWELEMPEWYVVTGYDERGYYYCGCNADEAKMPLPRDDLGRTEIGFLSMQCVLECDASPDHEVVSEAIRFALDHAEGSHHFEPYASGPEAWEQWAAALESGSASRFGAGYNAECWRECRAMAVEFLDEAGERLGREQGLFDEAIEHYSAVRDALSRVVERTPFDPSAGDATVRDPECAAIVREAKAAEARGLDALRRLAEAI